MANTVNQKVTLDTKDYLQNVKKMGTESHNATEKINKSFQRAKDEHHDNSVKMKKENLSIVDSMKNVGKSFASNVGKGAIGAGIVGAAIGIKKQVTDATKTVLDFDKQFAHLSQRFDLTTDKAKKLRKELSGIAANSGVNAALIGGGAETLMSANGGSSEGIDLIAKASKMGGGSPAEIARLVIDSLKGRGQELNKDNIKSFLTSANAIQRGGDYSLKESLGVLGMDAGVKDRLGLSSKENAGLIAASSKVGQDRGSTLQGLNALLAKSVDGLGKGSALSGLLGVSGGFMKDGKFDTSKLGDAAKNVQQQDLSKNDFIAVLEAEMGRDAAEGLYSIMTDFDKFHEAMQGTINDSKTLEQAFKESTDNIPDTMDKMSQGLAKGVVDIVSPLGTVGKELFKGNFSKAGGMLPGALKETGGEMMNNKGLVAATTLALGAGGLMMGKFGKLLGGGAAGIGKGMAIEKATGGEVESVYVVNANEIGSGMASLIPGAGKGMGMLGKIGAVGAAGGVGLLAGDLINEHLISKTEGTTSEGFEGNIVEQAFFKVAKLFGSESAKQIEKANQAFKIDVNVKDNTGRFTMEPSSNDLSRD